MALRAVAWLASDGTAAPLADPQVGHPVSVITISLPEATATRLATELSKKLETSDAAVFALKNGWLLTAQ